jgi:hypothetical protein
MLISRWTGGQFFDIIPLILSRELKKPSLGESPYMTFKAYTLIDMVYGSFLF